MALAVGQEKFRSIFCWDIKKGQLLLVASKWAITLGSKEVAIKIAHWIKMLGGLKDDGGDN